MIRTTILAFAAALLTGCAGFSTTDSQEQAGITQVHAEPVILDGRHVTTRYRVTTGKEYGSLNVEVRWRENGSPEVVQVKASSVQAFEGQAVSAQAVIEVQRELTRLGAAISGDARAAIMEAVSRAIPVPVP